MTVRRFLLVLAAVSATTLPACTTTTNPLPVVSRPQQALVPEVRVDERVELFSVIFRLAGAEEYGSGVVPTYARAIDAHFGAFRDHPVLATVRRLRSERGVSHNAVSDLAVQLGPLPALEERVALADAELDPRWTAEDARLFLQQARDFARQSDAAAFFAAQRPLYAIAERRMRDLIGAEADLRWVQRFFGGSGEQFVVVPSLTNTSAYYGSRYFGARGEREFYAIMAVSQVDEDGRPAFALGNVPVIVHEFGHAYVTPLILERYDADLRGAGEALLAGFGEDMRAQGYAEGAVILHETIIRAAVARYKLDTVDEAAARRELARQRRLGFLWVDEVYDLLGEYAADRARYRTFRDFYPRLRDYFAGLQTRAPAMAAAYAASRPQLVRFVPADGATDVDPATSAVTFEFDRPMRPSWGWAPVAGQTWPGRNAEIDAGRRVVTLHVRLQPSTTYAFPLLTSMFESAEGVPIRPTTLRFTTGSARAPASGG